MEHSSPGKNYEKIATAYAKTVDTHPMRLYYTRPHLWSLLPSNLLGLKVLDLGCGSGWYAEQLVNKGADVTALDASATMVELTKKRIGDKAKIYLADLDEPLNFLPKKYFDIILAPLVIHYVKEWRTLFTGLAAVIKNDGLFIFSTHNPWMDVHIFKLDNYFQKKLVTDQWKDVGEVQFYHHTFHDLCESLHQAGFLIERIIEPLPLPEMEQADPEFYKTLTTKPWVLFIRTIKFKTTKE